MNSGTCQIVAHCLYVVVVFFIDSVIQSLFLRFLLLVLYLVLTLIHRNTMNTLFLTSRLNFACSVKSFLSQEHFSMFFSKLSKRNVQNKHRSQTTDKHKNNIIINNKEYNSSHIM